MEMEQLIISLITSVNDIGDEFMVNIDPDLNHFGSFLSDEGICHTFSVEEFNNAIGELSSDIFIFSMNIRSFHKHKNELFALLSTLICEPDVIILTETWLNLCDLELATLEGYGVFHTVRQDARSGGVSIYHKHKFNACLLDNLSLCNLNIESCCVTVDFGDVKINVVGVYRPHSGTVNQFISEIDGILNDVDVGGRTRLCITGDFNVNLLDDLDDSSLNLMSFIQSNHLVPLIKKPTRYPANLGGNTLPTLLDHVWVNFLDCSLSGVLDIDTYSGACG